MGMRRLIYLLSILLLALNITSCKDNYFIENDLHGVWQVTSVERLSTGEVTKSAGDLYYMFQRSMVSLGYNDYFPESMSSYIAHFDLLGDSIGMGIFRIYSTGEGNNIGREVEVPLSSLHKFGIYEDYTMFHLQQSRQEMELVSDSARIVLRKY